MSRVVLEKTAEMRKVRMNLSRACAFVRAGTGPEAKKAIIPDCGASR